MKDEKHTLTIRDGFKDGLPIALGYFPIAMAFGLLSRNTNLSLFQTLGFSFVVFAGAAQFIGVGMIAAGASGLEIVVATFFLNLRHFLMSASLSARTTMKHSLFKPLIAFFVTDESFSVASFAKGSLHEKYMLPMQVTAYLGWGIGTGVGFVAGSILPELLRQAMEIGLYLMFVALLVPEFKKTKKAIVLSLLAGFTNYLVRFVLPGGWSIIVSILIVALLGTVIYDREKMGVVDYE